MSASWTRAQLRAAEAAWAYWQILLADAFANDDDGLLAAIEARSGITQAELYHQRIEADRAAGVFSQFADPGKMAPPARPLPLPCLCTPMDASRAVVHDKAVCPAR